jgi:Protein of unknown function (DUF2938)
MKNEFPVVLHVVLIGVGATLVMDLWTLLLKQLNVPVPNYALIGRWVGYMTKGKWFHTSVQKTEPISGEVLIGWLAHYSMGVLFAALLIFVCGVTWIKDPMLLPAVAIGVMTVVVPLFITQPAMGAGVLSRNTAQPVLNVTKSLMNHFLFGCGLFLSGRALVGEF